MNNLKSEHYPRMTKLKQSTREVHEHLDRKIMYQDPFSNLSNYINFLSFQYHLMVYVAPIYQNASLAKLIPQLTQRDRLHLLVNDFEDLKVKVPKPLNDQIPSSFSTEQALGWLYVIEGSKLGAAILAKHVSKLNLSAEYGAQFLAGPGIGRGHQWRAFMLAIEQLKLTPEQEKEVIHGACQAFKFANYLVEHCFSAEQV